MDSNQTSDSTVITDNTEQTGQAAAKTYTQQEFDDAMAKMKAAVTKRALKPYEGLGDPEELKAIRSDWEQRQQEQQLKRGEFEKTLQDLAAKKDEEIRKRDEIIRGYKIDSPLLDAAARYRSVNPAQVKSLLHQNIRLNADGEVEVVDAKGSTRYDDKGMPLSVDNLVREFLDSNPHFVSPTPATTATNSSVKPGSNAKVDIARLDMKNPEHREIYRQYRREHGIK